MFSLGMGFLPLSVGVVMLLSILITYMISVFRGDVESFFPYISDTGADSPESCIFSELFNITAFLAFSTMFLRHKLIREITGDCNARITRTSKICFALAMFSSFGLTLVANFQETNLEVVHIIGAFLVFGLGVLYMLLDSFVTYLMSPAYNGLRIYYFRISIAVIGLASLFITIIPGAMSREEWDNSDVTHNHTRLHWEKGDPGYAAHLVSSFGEWACAASFILYFVTYISDFSKFNINLALRLQVSHLDQVPINVPAPEGHYENSPLLA